MADLKPRGEASLQVFKSQMSLPSYQSIRPLHGSPCHSKHTVSSTLSVGFGMNSLSTSRRSMHTSYRSCLIGVRSPTPANQSAYSSLPALVRRSTIGSIANSSSNLCNSPKIVCCTRPSRSAGDSEMSPLCRHVYGHLIRVVRS